MRNNTLKIYEKLNRGEFISVDSINPENKHLYEEIEDNFADYSEYFLEIGLKLEMGNGYFYFSRIHEYKQSIEQKLESFSKWLDYMDFLKCYNQSFTTGFQFRKSHILEQINLNVDLKDKAKHLFKKYGAGAYVEIVNKLLNDMQTIGFAECVNEQEECFKITSAFHYAEELVELIQIVNEDEIPE